MKFKDKDMQCLENKEETIKEKAQMIIHLLKIFRINKHVFNMNYLIGITVKHALGLYVQTVECLLLYILIINFRIYLQYIRR
jgi:hypothetical protein